MAKNSGTGQRRMQNPTLEDFNTIKNVGKYFTFFKFVDMIVKCAKVTFSGTNIESETQI